MLRALSVLEIGGPISVLQVLSPQCRILKIKGGVRLSPAADAWAFSLTFHNKHFPQDAQSVSQRERYQLNLPGSRAVAADFLVNTPGPGMPL